MNNWYNTIEVFMMNYPELWIFFALALAAGLSMRQDFLAEVTRYLFGAAVLVGTGYLLVSFFHL
jgi:hypothetical protein